MSERPRYRISLQYFMLLLSIFNTHCAGDSNKYCKRITNQGLYSFSLPCSWELSEPNKYTVSITEESKDEKLKSASIMLLIQFMPREVPEDEYLRISKQQILEKYSKVNFKDVYSTKISGYNGKCIEVEYTEDQDRFFSLSAFAVSSNTALLFVAITPVNKAKNMSVIFKNILSSIKFDNPKKDCIDVIPSGLPIENGI